MKRYQLLKDIACFYPITLIIRAGEIFEYSDNTDMYEYFKVGEGGMIFKTSFIEDTDNSDYFKKL